MRFFIRGTKSLKARISEEEKKKLEEELKQDKKSEIDLKLYLCKYIDGKIKLNDHSEYKWVDKDDILDFDLADLDVELVRKMEDKYS